MATRLYFLPTTVPAQSPAFDTYTSTVEAQRRKLLTAAQGGKVVATETWQGNLTSGATNTSLMAQFISEPLDVNQTITGSYTLMVRARELTATDNIDSRNTAIKVYSGDGTTLRGTLRANAVSGGATEWGTALTGIQFATLGSLTSVSALAGDRIVLEVAARMSATGTTPQWEIAIGGNGTDHANTNGDTTGTVPWLEFSQNITFQIAAAPTGVPSFNSPYMGRW